MKQVFFISSLFPPKLLPGFGVEVNSNVANTFQLQPVLLNWYYWGIIFADSKWSIAGFNHNVYFILLVNLFLNQI